jgi:hypothetical protein
LTKAQISVDYYPEGDMLSITFGPKGRKGKGYELSEYIYIRIDSLTHEPLGLTILSYSKLLALNEFLLSFWDQLAPKDQDMMRAIFNSEPLNRFLNLKDFTTPIPVSTFHNPSLQEIVAG